MQGQQTPSIQQRVRGSVAWLYGEHTAVEAQLWLVALATLTLDVSLTYLGLRAGLAEGNPVMHAVFETVGFAGLGLFKGATLGVAGFARELRPEYGPVIALGLALPWLVAVVINAWLLF